MYCDVTTKEPKKCIKTTARGKNASGCYINTMCVLIISYDRNGS